MISIIDLLIDKEVELNRSDPGLEGHFLAIIVFWDSKVKFLS